MALLNIHTHVFWCTRARISLEYLPKLEVFYWKMTNCPQKLIHPRTCTPTACAIGIHSLNLLVVFKNVTAVVEIWVGEQYHIKLHILLAKGLPSEWQMRTGPEEYAQHSEFWNRKYCLNYSPKHSTLPERPSLVHTFHWQWPFFMACGRHWDEGEKQTNNYREPSAKRGKVCILWLNRRPPTFKCSATQITTTDYSKKDSINQLNQLYYAQG